MQDKTILFKFFKGQATDSEKEVLFRWIDASDENREEFNRERQSWNMLLMNTPDGLFEETFTMSDDQHSAKIIGFRRLLLYAATITFLVTGSWYVTKKAYENQKTSQEYQTIKVPVGQRTQVVLSDGSVVWINACSEFRFPAGFRGEKREVTLNGEAYFEVAHNQKMPFVVHTKEYNVTVKGTTFNISSYEKSKNFETTLLSGSVAISPVRNASEQLLLKPNEKAVLYNGTLKVVSYEALKDLYWTDGILYFQDLPFSEMLIRLERYYMVKFTVVNQKVLRYHCTGKFRQDETLRQILDVVKTDNHFKYKMDESGRQITIY